MADPFLITGPAVISFSGGRTSAYMLRRILQAHGGTLPDDVVVAFANTGREMPGTLDFVAEFAARWNVRIRWIEWRRDAATGKRWAEEVSHNSASRRGEPFRALLEAKGFLLPHPGMRYCTEELKVLTLKRFLKDALGWKQWVNVVGLRHDEPERVAARVASNARGGSPWQSVMPLDAAGITEEEVLAFWRLQPFQLRVPKWAGNCGGCFQKRIHQVARMFEEEPEHMEQWLEDEASSKARGFSGRYRGDRPSLAEIASLVSRQARLPLDPGPTLSACGVECG
ncbi:phosphoadenosine phosphosulfate reductase family protein [Falsiroseomonas tokyonensis]|uniref:Phosphoadenosine phosphosulfate reductase family protein n=1 Tax=Falsiroseomonas tokyonensis TaxID=430521 RepID=A0ABV7BXE7_9PROT|nr:phosphoadenosine phosphosulfate reductase family protein [Falsiroseomonas tokyonensis]MBU8540213.1 phosphoadenosine phosphosulfate reductase family protein [Falsiroseomonas tokyonensis]